MIVAGAETTVALNLTSTGASAEVATAIDSRVAANTNFLIETRSRLALVSGACNGGTPPEPAA
jgi:hypothetical protein